MKRLVKGVAACCVAAASVFLMTRESPDRSSSMRPFPKERPRVPAAPVRPPVIGGFSGSLPPFRPPADRKTNILRLLAAGEFLPAQSAISEWFSADPAAARDWLEMQPSFADFQPAISQIAKEMAESGDPIRALEWANLLENGPEREQTIFEIYATGRRYNWLSEAQIRAAPFPARRIEALLSGAADD